MHPQVCTRVMTALPHLLKEAPGLVEDVLQLDEVQQVLLESFLVCVDLLHLSLQHLKLALKVNHGCMGECAIEGLAVLVTDIHTCTMQYIQ